VAANGKRKPRRPRLALVSPAASKRDAAAIVAALEQFLVDTAPVPGSTQPERSAWQRAALEEGTSARQGSGRSWGDAA
jgi:hypothetical protein